MIAQLWATAAALTLLLTIFVLPWPADELLSAGVLAAFIALDVTWGDWGGAVFSAAILVLISAISLAHGRRRGGLARVAA